MFIRRKSRQPLLFLASLLLCLLLAACGGQGSTEREENAEAPELESAESGIIDEAARAPDSAGLPQPDHKSRYPVELYETANECYRVKMRTPYIGVEGIDSQITQWEAGLRNMYVRQFREECAGSRGSYELSMTYETSSTNGHAVSVLFLPSVDSGGAHPLTEPATLTFDTRTSKQLGYKDIFSSTFDIYRFFSDYAFRSLRPRLGQFWQDSAIFSAGLDPRPENFKNFVLTPEGLVLIFPQYQIAPYSEGIQSCLIPLEELVRFTPRAGIWQ